MIDVINRLIEERLKSLFITDVIIGTVTSINPCEIQFELSQVNLSIPAELIDQETIPSNTVVGDKYRFLRYNGGNRFLVIGGQKL